MQQSGLTIQVPEAFTITLIIDAREPTHVRIREMLAKEHIQFEVCILHYINKFNVIIYPT